MSDSWGEVETLPGRLALLRDGLAPAITNANVTERRRSEIARLEHELAELIDVIADLDRYRDHARTAPVLQPVTVRLVESMLTAKRVGLEARAADTRRSLDLLRARA